MPGKPSVIVEASSRFEARAKAGAFYAQPSLEGMVVEVLGESTVLFSPTVVVKMNGLAKASSSNGAGSRTR